MSTISYTFNLPGGRRETIALTFDPVSFALNHPPAATPEPWTALEFQQCPHCPLDHRALDLTDDDPASIERAAKQTEGLRTASGTKTQTHCPFALALSHFIHGFDQFYSYEKSVVEVVTEQRTIVTVQPLQDGMASIIGLVGATSGCPHLNFFRPMARFHLPFATEQETLFRAFSSHLLAEYLAHMQNGTPISLDTLHDRYLAVAQVNSAMANRIRAAFAKDAVVNAIIILDTFAQAVPWVIDKGLKELRPLFNSIPTHGHEPAP